MRSLSLKTAIALVMMGLMWAIALLVMGLMWRSHALQLCLISDRTFSDGVMSIRFG
ncbi:MAG: hypothetical protein RMY36_021710 [Nostoc sp. SerVER01]|nr:hypothetical protein [Nostoc sp. SerVER01]